MGQDEWHKPQFVINLNLAHENMLLSLEKSIKTGIQTYHGFVFKYDS